MSINTKGPEVVRSAENKLEYAYSQIDSASSRITVLIDQTEALLCRLRGDIPQEASVAKETSPSSGFLGHMVYTVEILHTRIYHLETLQEELRSLLP